MKKIVAVIPIRKGSQRVKNKNFRKFSNKNLLIYKILTLKKIRYLDDIIVNTDSDKAISIAKKLRVNFFRREDYFASSKCTNSDFWQNIASTTTSKYILLTHCTSPLVKVKTYEKIISTFFYKEREKFNSLNTVNEVKDYLFFKHLPLNFKLKKVPNSQNLTDIVKYNSAISILRTDYMKKNKTVFGNKPFFYKLDQFESHDINTEYDFKFAEYLFKTNKFDLL